MQEHEYEKILNIKTSGKQDVDEATMLYNTYEATDYAALDKLFDEYKLKDTDSVVDFGSGKGRLNFYLNHKFGCNVTGIEMNKYFHKKALENKKSYLDMYDVDSDSVNFICTYAEKYKIRDCDNKFYFFNPFAVGVFMKVIDNIIGSVMDYKRDAEIILFYPIDEYIYFLDQFTYFTLQKEVRLDTFMRDGGDRFLVYKLSYLG